MSGRALGSAPSEPNPGEMLVLIMKDKKKRDHEAVDPAERSGEAETRELALKQTMAARQMFAKPKPELKKQLGTAATKLSQTFERLDDELRDALGARLFGEQGLMAKVGGEATGVDKKVAQRNELAAILRRVAGDGGSSRSEETPASGSDRSTVIALMGDIGALFTDTGATTGTARDSDASDKLRKALATEISGPHSLKLVTESFARVKEVGGSEAVGPKKGEERFRNEPEDMPVRTGIHNLGSEADLGAEIPLAQQLGASKWSVARIDKARVDETAEPFAGHMSGSPSEILQVWDMLVGVPSYDQFTDMEDQRQRLETTVTRLQQSILFSEDMARSSDTRKEQTAKLAETFRELAEFYKQGALDYRQKAEQPSGGRDTPWASEAERYEREAREATEKADHWAKRSSEVWGADAENDRKAAKQKFEELKTLRVEFEESPARNERLARAAGAAAFLVGQGYHSAMEVAEGVLRYDGQNLRAVLNADPETYVNQDAGDLLYAGAATDLMCDLMEGQTSS